MLCRQMFPKTARSAFAKVGRALPQQKMTLQRTGIGFIFAVF